MRHFLLTILALAASNLLLISAQQAFATQCYYKADNEERTSTGGPCGIVTPNPMRHFLLTILALAASNLLLISAQQAFATQCYYKADNEERTSTGGPCGIVTPNPVRPFAPLPLHTDPEELTATYTVPATALTGAATTSTSSGAAGTPSLKPGVDGGNTGGLSTSGRLAGAGAGGVMGEVDGMYKLQDGMSASLAGRPIEGVGANSAPVQEKIDKLIMLRRQNHKGGPVLVG
ncbi:uncharacterized protein PAC_00258 [Phialocephala subalpina]|uniref:Uncharacterized protein n=1 Tax=Phialocephala subalpina TaxID=576137 RepID=A0A1L7WC72_9HELO|nr:uncharacterized protein PAC_00258 [Phialocephala subalpina]